MLLFSILIFVVALVFGAAWGAGENRCWKEHGEAVILNNFRLYHFLMALLFGAFNAFAVCLIFNIPVEGLVNAKAALCWLWLMLWDTLILDVVWWVIRYCDFKRDYEKAVLSYNGERNVWHEWPDWDNCPVYIIRFDPLQVEKVKLPLFFGVYWWWLAFPAMLTVIGVVVLHV